MLKIRSKTKVSQIVMGCVAAGLLGVLPAAFGNYSESFESGTLNGWNAGSLNGSVGTVNTARSTDGVYSYGNSFTVSTNFAGWTVSTILDQDARSFLNAGATSMSVDVYSDWANPNGWGVYGNTIKLVLNYQGGWTTVDPATGSLANGSFQTFTYNLAPYAATITNPGLSYSSFGIAWFVGTWAGGQDNLDNGTQTFAVDNIRVTQPVPEPASLALVGLGGLSAILFRRRNAR
jgi:hypothetical protein